MKVIIARLLVALYALVQSLLATNALLVRSTGNNHAFYPRLPVNQPTVVVKSSISTVVDGSKEADVSNILSRSGADLKA